MEKGYEQEVRNELKTVDGNKYILVTKYQGKLNEIIREYGGQISDIPMTHPEYWELKNKLMVLDTIK